MSDLIAVTTNPRPSAMDSAVRSVAFARSRSCTLIGISSMRRKRSAVESEGTVGAVAERIDVLDVMVISQRGLLHCTMPI